MNDNHASPPSSADPVRSSRSNFFDGLIALALFSLSLIVFLKSDVCQIGDSRYSLLITEHLIAHGDVNLKSEFSRPLDPARYPNLGTHGYPANMHDLGDRVYYGAPIGSSVISAPFVMLFNAAGIHVRGADGIYDARAEDLMQMRLAAFLMAGLTALIYLTGRLLLPAPHAVLISLGLAFGTQIWSTASRALWSHTWMITLLSLAVYQLARVEIRGERLRPIALATILAWAYFVRPSANFSIAAIALYVLLRRRRDFLWLAATGGAWLAGFVAYSWHDYHAYLPPYYRLGGALSVSRMAPKIFMGLLISPSRGQLVCVPLTLLVIYLFVTGRGHLPAPRLARLGGGVILVHVAVISLLPIWVLHAGSSFGARYLTDILPWLSLLLIQGVAAWRRRDARSVALRCAELCFAALLFAAGVLINWRGATAAPVWNWNNGTPGNEFPELQYRWVMDWRYPQWLAGWIPPPAPEPLPVLKAGVPIEFGSQDAAPYLRRYFGWSGPEGAFDRTDGKRAHVIFAAEHPDRAARLEIRLEPFLAPGRIPRQRCRAVLNGRPILDLDLTAPGITTYAIDLPPGYLGASNLLVFKLPDATSLSSLKLSPDTRVMGIKVYRIELIQADS